MTDPTLGFYDTADLREAARRRLPKGLFEFMDRGNDDELAMRDNHAVLASIKLNPRVLNDVSVRHQDITLFGKPQKMPVIVAPTGSAGLAWHEGEIAIARAARAHGVPFTLALGSMTKLERVAAEAGGPGSSLWFQFYMWPERKLSHQVIARAKDAGFEALVFTVDTPVAPGREYNLKNHPVQIHHAQHARCIDASALARRCVAALHAHHRHAALSELSGIHTNQNHRAADGPLIEFLREYHLGRCARAAPPVAAQTDR